MIQAIKTARSKIANAIITLPVVRTAHAVNKRLKAKHSLYLFRREKFLLAAALKHLFSFVVAVLVVAFVAHLYRNDPSGVVRLFKPLTASIAALYPISNTYFLFANYKHKHKISLALRSRRKRVLNASR